MHFARPELELVNVRICKLRNFYSYRTLIDIYAFYEHSLRTSWIMSWTCHLTNVHELTIHVAENCLLGYVHKHFELCVYLFILLASFSHLNKCSCTSVHVAEHLVVHLMSGIRQKKYYASLVMFGNFKNHCSASKLRSERSIAIWNLETNKLRVLFLESTSSELYTPNAQ